MYKLSLLCDRFSLKLRPIRSGSILKHFMLKWCKHYFSLKFDMAGDMIKDSILNNHLKTALVSYFNTKCFSILPDMISLNFKVNCHSASSTCTNLFTFYSCNWNLYALMGSHNAGKLNNAWICVPEGPEDDLLDRNMSPWHVNRSNWNL